MPRRTFTKIKYDGSEVVLRWETTSATGLAEKHTYQSQDAPHPDFVEALAALAPAVADACELPDDALTVRGVTLKDAPSPEGGGEMVDGVCITALRELDWTPTPLVVNTPFAPVEVVPHHGLGRLLKTLRREADAYLDGKRRQGDLFAEDADETGDDYAVPMQRAFSSAHA